MGGAVGAVGQVIGRRRAEGVASRVVRLRVHAAAPHEGGQRVGVGHEDHRLDQLRQRPAGLRPRTHQLLRGAEDRTGHLDTAGGPAVAATQYPTPSPLHRGLVPVQGPRQVCCRLLSLQGQ